MILVKYMIHPEKKGSCMQYPYVFFDLDGTLTDSGEGIANSGQYAFEQLGLPVPDRKEFRKMVGPPLATGFSVLGVPEERIEDAIRLYREHYARLGKYQNCVYPGIENLLKQLKQFGYRLYVATSKPESLAKEILSEFGLLQYFEYIAGATWDHSRESKDSVLCYLVSLIGTIDGIVMVGDTHYDVIGAHKRGIPCIGVTWGYGLKTELQVNAEAVISSPEELLPVLRSVELLP